MPVILLITLLATVIFLLTRDNASGLSVGASEAETTEVLYVAEAGLRHARWVADTSSCSNFNLPPTPFGQHSYSALFTPAGGSPITIAATGTLATGAMRTLTSEGTAVYQAPIQTTEQPDAAVLVDTFIDAFKPTWNHGVNPTLRVRGGSTPRHSLLRFDLDVIPTGAKLVSAVLELNSSNIFESGSVSAHRVTNGWPEGTLGGSAGNGATWDERDTGEPWVTAGGDYDPTPVATTVVAAPANSWHQWDVTALFDAWINGGAINNGLILVPDDASVNAFFHSSDGSDPAKHPGLILTYACECGVGGATGSTTLQPGAGAGKDAFLHSTQPTRNFGGKGSMTLYDLAGAHPIIQFDLSSLPAGATVTVAELQLYATTVSDSGMATAHRVTGPWIEGTCAGTGCVADGATWNTTDGTTPWLTPGGDHDMMTSSPSVSIDNAGTWALFDVTQFAAGWANGSFPNHGLLLHPDAGVQADLSTSDATSAALHPRLSIDFYCPCGVDCTAGGGGGGAGSYCEADFAATSKAYHFDWTPGAADVTGIDFLPEGTVVNGVTMPAGGGWIMVDRNKDKFFVSDALGVSLTEFTHSFSDARGIAFIESGPWTGHIAVADKSDDAVYFMDLNGVILGSFPTAGITTDPYGLSFIGETDSHVYEDHLVISSNKDGTGDTNGGVYIVDQSGILKRSIDVESYAPRPQGVAHLTGNDKLMVADRDGPVSIIDFNGNLLNQYDAATWGFAEMQGVTIHPETCEHMVIDKKALRVAALSTGGGGPEGGSANLLMVVANTSNLTTQEDAKKALFETWDYTVSLIGHGAFGSVYDAAVAVNDVAFVGEDITANKLSDKLADAAIGVVTEEANLSDEFGLSSSVGWSSDTVLDIDDDSHYITQPFALGPLEILAADSDLADLTGTLAPDLRVLGSAAAGPLLVTLEAGGETFNSLPAAGRRAQLPWGDSNFALDNLTASGETILKRSLEWGVQPAPRCDADFAANNVVSEFGWMAGTADIHGIDYLPPGLIVNSVTVPAGGGWIMSDKSKDRLFVADIAGNPLTDFPLLAFDTQGVALIDAGTWIHHLAVADKAALRVYYLDLDGEIVTSFSTIGITTGNPLGLSFIGATASATYDSHLAISSDKDATGGGTATVYIVDQAGTLKKTIDVEAFAPTPQGVAHLTGADKLLVTDKNGMVSVIDFDGNLLHQYSSAAFGLTEVTDVAIHPTSCEHVIVDKDFKKIASLDPNAGGGGGGGPRYIEMSLPWTAVTPETWETKNLGIFGVPANAVVEVAVVNAEGGKELWGGVRAMGSTLERRLQLHEADGGGVDAMVLHVQTDSAGRIEHYSDDPDKLSFVLLGYWTESTYVENWQAFKAGASLGWQPHALSAYGVGDGEVAEILMVNNDGFLEHQAGVRTAGSSLQRIVNLHEAKDGGDEGTTLFSVARPEPDATVEVYADDDASIDFYLLGHWKTPPGTFTSAFTDLGTAAVKQVWEDTDLGSFGVPANAVAQIAPVNSEDGAEAFLGVRAKGSAMSRWLDLHQSKNGGDDLAAMHVNTDASSLIQWYDEDTGKIHRFYLLGWWVLP